MSPAMAGLLLALAVALCSVSVMRFRSPQENPEGTTNNASTASAAIACSEHGRVFDDSPGASCECSFCYTGLDCSQRLPGCAINADNGDPTFLEQFWRRQKGAAGGVFIPSWYRMSYMADEASQERFAYVTKELQSRIRELHAFVGNAVTEDRYLVLGTGSIQLLAAAVSALSDNVSPKPALVVSRAPCFSLYKTQMEVLSSTKFRWGGDAEKALLNEEVDPASVIEVVASPNNPDTRTQQAAFKGTKASIVHDYAYYWPHFTPITRAADEDVMLFSMSKLTGHAGSRVGWAIVKDLEVYKKMVLYILVSTLGVSHESQLRASRLIKATLDGYISTNAAADNEKLFHYAYQLMQSRWQTISKIFKDSTRFSLQNVQPEYCSFFNATVLPAPAYAWLECLQPAHKDCHAVFKAGGIRGRGGAEFGLDNNRYLRLSLIKREQEFSEMVNYLEQFI